jgi:hypothetical protein
MSGLSDPCNGEWTSTLETWDPALITLTRTTASGSWYEYGAAVCRLHASGAGTCWSANPSALGTHWFTSNCGWTSPTTLVDINVVGSYYNYDFGLPSLITNVTQNVRIRLINGISITFSHNDSGEFSSLLFGVYWQQGHNTCF